MTYRVRQAMLLDEFEERVCQVMRGTITDNKRSKCWQFVTSIHYEGFVADLCTKYQMPYDTTLPRCNELARGICVKAVKVSGFMLSDENARIDKGGIKLTYYRR